MYAVTLNVYDLNAANDWTHGAGVGFYHSGVEVAGREWTFGSGSGSRTGVTEHGPRETGLPLRESILLGETELSGHGCGEPSLCPLPCKRSLHCALLPHRAATLVGATSS